MCFPLHKFKHSRRIIPLVLSSPLQVQTFTLHHQLHGHFFFHSVKSHDIDVISCFLSLWYFTGIHFRAPLFELYNKRFDSNTPVYDTYINQGTMVPINHGAVGWLMICSSPPQTYVLIYCCCILWLTLKCVRYFWLPLVHNGDPTEPLLKTAFPKEFWHKTWTISVYT